MKLWTVRSEAALFEDWAPISGVPAGIGLWDEIGHDLIVEATIEQAAALRDVPGVWSVTETTAEAWPA